MTRLLYLLVLLFCLACSKQPASIPDLLSSFPAAAVGEMDPDMAWGAFHGPAKASWKACWRGWKREYDDHRSLLRDYISEEELWACTTCNACAQECPVNINHPTLIVDMRRYLVMEEASAPGELKSMFNYIENNGAPWQYSSEDRLLWTKDLEMTIYQEN